VTADYADDADGKVGADPKVASAFNDIHVDRVSPHRRTATWTHNIEIERLSFKGTVDTLRQWAPLFSHAQANTRAHAANSCASSPPIESLTVPIAANREPANAARNPTRCSHGRVTRWLSPRRVR